jgi:hypothetical protein
VKERILRGLGFWCTGGRRGRRDEWWRTREQGRTLGGKEYCGSWLDWWCGVVDVFAIAVAFVIGGIGFWGKKGGVRAVVKAPGRRLFKRRKSPSVIVRKGGIGEQSWNFWNWISAIFLQFTIVWATVPSPEEEFLLWWFLFTSEQALAPDMINTRVGNWIIFLTTKASHQECGICELHFLWVSQFQKHSYSCQFNGIHCCIKTLQSYSSDAVSKFSMNKYDHAHSLNL